MSYIYTRESGLDALSNVHIQKIRLPREDYLELMVNFCNMLVHDQLDELIYLSDLTNAEQEQIAGKALRFIKVMERRNEIRPDDFSFLQKKLAQIVTMRQVLNNFNKLALELYMRSTSDRVSMVGYDRIGVETGDDHENLENEDREPPVDTVTVDGRDHGINSNQVRMPVEIQRDDERDTTEVDLDLEENLLRSTVLGADVRYTGSRQVEDCAVLPGPSEQGDTHHYENSSFFRRPAKSSREPGEDTEDHISDDEDAFCHDIPPPIPKKTGEEENPYTEISEDEDEQQEDYQVGDEDENVAQACASSNYNEVEDAPGRSDYVETKTHEELTTNQTKEKSRGLGKFSRLFSRRGSSQSSS